MASIVRGQILRDDVALFDGVTRTSSRVDATGGTVTGLNFGEAVDILQVFGGGTSRSVATINNAIGRLGGANGAFQFSTGTWTIDSNLTIPATIAVHIPAGCVFAISSGITLTISGPFYADMDIISSGSGTLVLSGVGVNVTRYGALGDGSTDDTTAIQKALNSGHKYVFGNPQHTYLVSHASTTTINSVSYRYCLTIPSGVVFDLNGSTLKLAASQNSSLAAMVADDAMLINGVLDFNRTNQTTPATGDMACVLAYDVDRIRVENIRAKNVRQYAGRFMNCRDSDFINLRCDDSYGDGWSLGTTGSAEFRLFDCKIDRIHAEDCEGTYGSLEGNGIIVTTVNCQIGSLYAKDCGGGTKIQNSTTGTTIDSSEFDGDDHTYSSVNSGTKVQGFAASSLYPTDVAIGKIVSRNCYGNGLFLSAINSLSIGSYQGYNNGSGSGATGSDQNDVEINTTDGSGPKLIQIGRMIIDEADAQGWRHQGTGNINIDSIVVRNPTGPAVQDTGTGRIKIGHILALDDQGSPTLTYAFYSTAISKGRIDLIETNLLHDTSTPRVLLVAQQYDFEIGQIRLGSTDVLGGVQALTNASTTTAVTCGHIWRSFVGNGADYFHPIIDIIPWDATSMALGVMRYTVTDGSGGTGFTITHASAATGDDVLWTVRCWKVVSKAAA